MAAVFWPKLFCFWEFDHEILHGGSDWMLTQLYKKILSEVIEKFFFEKSALAPVFRPEFFVFRILTLKILNFLSVL